MKDITEISQLVRKLYEIVAELESFAPGRHFTLDGHLVGSIGEIWARQSYSLELAKSSMKSHDAVALDRRLVQIKTTQGDRVGLSSEPEYLLVLKLGLDGSLTEIYNGPGNLVWKACGKPQKNGQSTISVKTLQRLMADCVDPGTTLPRITA